MMYAPDTRLWQWRKLHRDDVHSAKGYMTTIYHFMALHPLIVATCQASRPEGPVDK